MSPLNIKILLHYYAIPGDWHQTVPIEQASSGAARDTIELFLRQGLLSSHYGDHSWAIGHASEQHTPKSIDNDTDTNQFFKITDKGVAMVDHLMAVQVPVCKWIQP